MGTGEMSEEPDEMLRGNLRRTNIPSRRSSNTPSRYGNQAKVWLCEPLGSCADFYDLKSQGR